MKARLMEEVKGVARCPEVCTKPGCGGRVFLPHEDGWQCFNCMKIVYDEQPLPLVTARPIKIGRYRTAEVNKT